MATLFHGKGADYHPRVPLIDRMLSNRLQALGFQTRRYGADCVFTSTSRDQANDYARDDDHLFQVEPLESASVMIVDGCKDMILQFEAWLRDKSIWEDRNGSVRSRFLADVQGDIGTVETYLGLNRMKKVIASLIDEYLSDLSVREFIVDENFDIQSAVEGHEGEIIINGPVKLHPIITSMELRM